MKSIVPAAALKIPKPACASRAILQSSFREKKLLTCIHFLKRKKRRDEMSRSLQTLLLLTHAANYLLSLFLK